MTRRRTSLLATAAATLASLSLAGPALAAPTVVRDSGIVRVAPAGYANSDCSMRAQLVNDPATGNVYGRGSAWCSGRKASVIVTQTIKATASDGTVYSYASTPTSLVSDQWVYSRSFQNGCYRWQTVTNVQITDTSNRVTRTYVTSGSPVKFLDHCPF